MQCSAADSTGATRADQLGYLRMCNLWCMNILLPIAHLREHLRVSAAVFQAPPLQVPKLNGRVAACPEPVGSPQEKPTSR